MRTLGWLLVAAACGNSGNDGGVTVAHTTPPPVMLTAGPEVNRTPAGAPQVNVADRGLERYQRIVRNVADCELEGYQIVPTCAGMHELTAGIARVPVELRAELGRSMIGHASPAVRVKAAELMNVAHGAGPARESQDAIADAASRERHVGVLRAMIRVVADKGAENPKVGALLLAAADHADKDVRLQAVYALTSQANRGLPGGSTKLAQLAEHDADPKVRTSACEYAGKLAGDDLLPLYQKMTASSTKAKDPDLYAACMEGLVRMFHDHPILDTANEKAYRLFVQRLAETPRSETSPPWSVMSTFCYFSHGADSEKVVAWKQRAPWFDAAEVKRVMTSVISDKATSWMARAAAVESMVGLGATKQELEALRRSIDPRDKSVLDKIASGIAE